MQESVNINVESGMVNFKEMKEKLPLPTKHKRINSASVKNTGRVMNKTMGNLN